MAESKKKTSAPKKRPKATTGRPALVRTTHSIDANGVIMGRLATQVVGLLRGKHKVTFVPYIDAGDFVIIKNITQIKFSGDKLLQKLYRHHSQFPGGLKTRQLGHVMAMNPSKTLRLAVWRMLPKNKLRHQMIKRLKIS